MSRSLGRIVVDRTGLEGSFDFKVAYASPPDDSPNVTDAIIAAVRELGLKLEAGRGPVRTLAIDQIEKPSAN